MQLLSVVCTVLHRCTKLGEHIFIQYADQILAFYEIQYGRGRRPPCWICWGKPWDHPHRYIHGSYPMQEFRHDRRGNVEVRPMCCCHLRLKVVFVGPKFHLWGFGSQNFGEHRSRPQKARQCAEWRILSRVWSRLDEPCSSTVQMQAFPIGENSGKFGAP